MTEFEMIDEIEEELEIEDLAKTACEESEQDTEEREALLSELNALKEELARRDAIEEGNRRMMRECEQFKDYFPNTDLSSIPDEVWESVKDGIPLAASYALYERKEALRRERAEELNSRNKMMSAGSVKRGGEEKYYSPSEVRSMTRDQVKSNYSDIIESMRHWH